MNKEKSIKIFLRDNNHIIISTFGFKYNGRDEKQEGVLVMTNRGLIGFYDSFEKPDFIDSWTNFNRIKKVTQNQVLFEFGNRTIFLEVNNADSVLNTVNSIIPHFLKKSELQRLGIDFPSNGLKLFFRHSRFVELQGESAIKSDIELFRVFLMKHSKSLDLSQFTTPSVVHVLDCLEDYPYLESIYVPYYSNDQIIVKIFDYIGKIPTLKVLSIESAQNISLFSSFKQYYNQKGLNCAISLKFINSNLSGFQFKELNDIMLKKGIQSISLINSSFGVFSPSVFSELKYLGMQSYHEICDDFLSKMSQLTHISLVDCSLDVGIVFEKFPITFCVQHIDLSKNFSSKEINTIPHSLETLVLDDIKWSNNSLRSLLTLCNCNRCLKVLSISNIEQSAIEWKSTNEGFKEVIESNLTHIFWDGNPVSNQFFQFLSNCGFLTTLSLCNCFDYKMKNEITLFSSMIPKLKGLHTLYLIGSPSKSMKSGIISIIETIITHKSMKHINVSNNEVGDKSITRLSEMLTNENSLESMEIDGSNTSNLTILLDLMRILYESGSQIKIGFPFNDICKLKNTDEDHNLFLQEWTKYQDDDQGGDPFNVHFVEKEYAFPSYYPNSKTTKNELIMNNISSSDDEKTDWSSIIELVPTPTVEDLMNEKAELYSLPNLLRKMKSAI